MTITQTPLERAALRWADSAAILAAELARAVQPQAITAPQSRQRRRKAAHLRVVPVTIGAAAVAWDALRRHAAAAAISVVTAAAATTIAVPAISNLTVRTLHEHHHAWPAATAPAAVSHRTIVRVRVTRTIRPVPRYKAPPASPAGLPSPQPVASASVSVSASGPPLTAVIPTPAPAPSCSGISVLGICLP